MYDNFFGYGTSLDDAKLLTRRRASEEGAPMGLFVSTGESGERRYAIRYFDGEWATPDLEYVAYPQVINQFG